METTPNQARLAKLGARTPIPRYGALGAHFQEVPR